MNNREKFLIIILAAAIILMGGFKLLIEPALKSLSSTNTAYIKAGQDITTYQEDKSRANRIDAENQKLETTISSDTAAFFPELTNDKIQLFFQNLANAAGISYSIFIMEPPVASQIINTTSTDSSIDYPAKDAADEIASINNGTPPPANGDSSSQATTSSSETSSQVAASSTASAASNILPKDAIEMMIVTIQFDGSYDQALSLLNGIKSSGRTVRVSSFNMTTGNAGGTTVSISAECYGVQKFTDTDPLSKDTLQPPAGKANPFS